MKLAIIGHKGYIGSVLYNQAINKKHDILGIDSNLFQNAYLGKHSNIKEELYLDIRNITEKHLKDIDVVIHLANLSNDPLCNLNPELTYKINYNASIQLAKIAKKAGVEKFIFASSSSVYGQSEKKLIKENHNTNPLTPYSEAKVMVEKDLDTLSSDKFRTFALRFATAYGWSPCMRFDLVINNLVAAAFSEKKLVVRDSPELWRPFVHVNDIAASIITIAELDKKEFKHSNIFNVGRNEDNYTVNDLVKIILEQSNSKLEIVYKPNGLDKRSYWIDSNKLQNSIGNNIMKWNVHKGIKELFNKYNEHNITTDIYQSVKFSRIEQIKYLLDKKIINKDLYNI